jgi:hypothetical protein
LLVCRVFVIRALKNRFSCDIVVLRGIGLRQLEFEGKPPLEPDAARITSGPLAAHKLFDDGGANGAKRPVADGEIKHFVCEGEAQYAGSASASLHAYNAVVLADRAQGAWKRNS